MKNLAEILKEKGMREEGHWKDFFKCGAQEK